MLSKFRHKTWELGGLVDRQKFHVTVEEHRAKLADEKQFVARLRSELQSSQHFQAYTPKHRANLLAGDWRVGKGWSDLGTTAGFHPKYFKNVYAYLCGYSHSSYLSALQVGQAQSIDDQRMLSRAILGIGIVVMGHFAFSYSGAFESAAKVLSESPDAQRIAEKWRFGPEDMSAIYDR